MCFGHSDGHAPDPEATRKKAEKKAADEAEVKRKADYIAGKRKFVEDINAKPGRTGTILSDLANKGTSVL